MGDFKIQGLTIDDIAQMLSVSRKWVYRHSKAFDAAKIKLAGKAIRPTRYDAEALRMILSSDRSLIIEGSSDLPQRKVGRL